MDTTAVASGEPMVQAAGAGLGPWAVWNYGMRYRLQNPAVMTDCRALREAIGLNGPTSLAWGTWHVHPSEVFPKLSALVGGQR